MCSVAAIDIDFIESKVVESRQKELIVVRLLLKEMGVIHLDLVYDENRKPFIQSSSLNISISHTTGIVCIMLSEVDAVGVDIEKVSNRVEKIKHKFLNAHEIEYYDACTENLKLKWLLLAWCTKEALYKYTSRIYYDFKAHFKIQNIDFNTMEIVAICQIGSEKAVEKRLEWKLLENDYLLVYTIPTPNV